MKKLKKWFKDCFGPEDFNNLDTGAIAEALNDHSVRAIWLLGCFEEMKRINMEVDKRLLSGSEASLTDLCARRKAYQDMLEAVLGARRQAKQSLRHNPMVPGINLDRVTA